METGFIPDSEAELAWRSSVDLRKTSGREAMDGQPPG
jgi:hypothetical protein